MEAEDILKSSVLIVGALILIAIVSSMSDSVSVLHTVSAETITVAGTATGTTNTLANPDVKVGTEVITTYCPA